MSIEGLECLKRAGNGFDNMSTVPHRSLHFCDVAGAQLVLARTDVLAGYSFTAQRLFDNLQIRHPRNGHAVQRAGRTKHRLRHRNRVILECSKAPAAYQCTVQIPEEDAK